MRLEQIPRKYKNTENKEENKALIETLTFENKNIDLRRGRKVPTANPHATCREDRRYIQMGNHPRTRLPKQRTGL